MTNNNNFSYGQSFFNDILQFSTKHSHHDEKRALNEAFEIQLRGNDFFKNNFYDVLHKSQEYSGETNLEGTKKVPLGGALNPYVGGTTNIPGSGACAPEFPFWNKNFKPVHRKRDDENSMNKNESLPPQPQPKVVENFTNDDSVEKFTVNRENMGDNNNTMLIIIISIAVVVIVIIILFMMRKSPSNMMKMY